MKNQSQSQQKKNPKLSEMNQQKIIKLLIIGDAAVGKTSLIYQYINNHFPQNYISTVGIDFKEKNINIGKKNIRLQIWDTAGQERFHTITKAYYRGAHGLIIVFDITNPESFQNISYWLQNIQESCDNQHEKIMVGNKSDLSEDRKVSAEQIAATCEHHSIKYIQTSSKTGSNVKEVFQTLAEFVLVHQDQLRSQQKSRIKIKEKEAKIDRKKKCSC